MKAVSRKNAEHYNWKEVCDGWHFTKSDELSVIAEKMPPYTEEDMHFHHKSKQFFYILSGEVPAASHPVFLRCIRYMVI